MHPTASPPARVWLAPHTVPTPADLDTLDDADRARMAAFVRAEDRALYAAAHGFLRRVLAECTGRPAASLRFATEEKGRPYLLTPEGRRASLGFSLSHCAAGVAVAVQENGPIGIDVEIGSRLADVEPLVAHIASQAEARAFSRLPTDARRAAFLRLWTGKEALLKAEGSGFLIDPRTVTIGCSFSSSPAMVTHAGVEWRVIALPCAWATASVAVAGDGSVIVETDGPEAGPSA